MVKRGISPLIATVLLVGFTVALGAIVSTYLIKEAKEFNPESFIEESAYCESLILEPLVIEGPPNMQPRQPWPLSTVVPATQNDNDLYTQGLAECSSTADVCLIQGLGFKNKGSFSLHSVLITAPGSTNQLYLPVRDSNPGQAGNVRSITKIGPGKNWGYDDVGTAVVRNLAIAYNPENVHEADETTRIFKVTPQVQDIEKTEERGIPVIIPCSKQEITFDIGKVCPCCWCSTNRCGGPSANCP